MQDPCGRESLQVLKRRRSTFDPRGIPLTPYPLNGVLKYRRVLSLRVMSEAAGTQNVGHTNCSPSYIPDKGFAETSPRIPSPKSFEVVVLRKFTRVRLGVVGRMLARKSPPPGSSTVKHQPHASVLTQSRATLSKSRRADSSRASIQIDRSSLVPEGQQSPPAPPLNCFSSFPLGF